MAGGIDIGPIHIGGDSGQEAQPQQEQVTISDLLQRGIRVKEVISASDQTKHIDLGYLIQPGDQIYADDGQGNITTATVVKGSDGSFTTNGWVPTKPKPQPSKAPLPTGTYADSSIVPDAKKLAPVDAQLVDHYAQQLNDPNLTDAQRMSLTTLYGQAMNNLRAAVDKANSQAPSAPEMHNFGSPTKPIWAMGVKDPKTGNWSYANAAGSSGGQSATQFATDLLKGLGVKPTPELIRAVAAWHAAEGGSASFNPLNTTQPADGATNYNGVGVKNYPSYQAGLQATIQTLQNGRYGPILEAMRNNDPEGMLQAVGASPWGTNGTTALSVYNGRGDPTTATISGSGLPGGSVPTLHSVAAGSTLVEENPDGTYRVVYQAPRAAMLHEVAAGGTLVRDDGTVLYKAPPAGSTDPTKNPLLAVQQQQEMVNYIHQQWSAGTIDAAYANALFAASKQQAAAALAGTTPYDMYKDNLTQQYQRAQIGRDLLNNQLQQGAALTNDLLNQTGKLAGGGYDPIGLAQSLTAEASGDYGAMPTSATAKALIDALNPANPQPTIASATSAALGPGLAPMLGESFTNYQARLGAMQPPPDSGTGPQDNTVNPAVQQQEAA